MYLRRNIPVVNGKKLRPNIQNILLGILERGDENGRKRENIEMSSA
jgi:hypothetical protein